VILIFGDASAQRMQHQQRRASGEDDDGGGTLNPEPKTLNPKP